MEFKLQNDEIENIRKTIGACQLMNHIQQVAFSTYHDCLTQVCFTCEMIRTSMDKRDYSNSTKEELEYCCKHIKELDEKEIIDYCPPNLTSIDVNKECYPIYFCPFCGAKIKGSKEFVDKLKDQVKGIEDGSIKTQSFDEMMKSFKEKKNASQSKTEPPKTHSKKQNDDFTRENDRATQPKRVISFMEEEIFKIIDNFFKDKQDVDFVDIKKLKDRFRTPQGFRRAIERDGLVGTNFSNQDRAVPDTVKGTAQDKSIPEVLIDRIQKQQIKSGEHEYFLQLGDVEREINNFFKVLNKSDKNFNKKNVIKDDFNQDKSELCECGHIKDLHREYPLCNVATCNCENFISHNKNVTEKKE